VDPIITPALLDTFLGKTISDLCKNGFTNNSDNHCAHFVSHVLGLGFGTTCRTMGTGKQAGANLRVQEIFPRCQSVGAWANRPVVLINCLVFITRASNVNLPGKTMANVPRKHIGIYHSGLIWHYSNIRDKVVKQTPAEFANHYSSPDNAMFFGTIP
jgi:hypothetical protein